MQHDVHEFASVPLHLLRGVPGRVVDIAGVDFGVTDFVLQLNPHFGEPVGFTGLIGPELDELLLHVAAGVAGRHGDEVELIDFRPFLLLIAGIDRRDVASDTGAGGVTVDTDHLAAVLRRRAHREHAARAAANDENVGGHGLRNIFLRDLRGFAEPVARVFLFCRFLRDHFNGDLALRLGDTLGGRLLNGVRGDRRARHRIHFCRLAREQRLLQFHRGLLPDPGGFL